MNNKEIIKLYWDLDGVCAKWNTKASIEDTYMPGYFANRAYQWNVIWAMYQIAHEHPEIEVNILSHYYMNGCALADKQTWCNYMDNVCTVSYPNANIGRIFVPYGLSKYLFINQKENTVNILIDDYTKNLLEWNNAGREASNIEANAQFAGIKFLNGINHTRRTWVGAMISHTDTTEEIIKKIEEYIDGLLCA